MMAFVEYARKRGIGGPHRGHPRGIFLWGGIIQGEGKGEG